MTSDIYNVYKTGNNRIYWTDEQRDLILDLYCNQGMSSVKIGELFGLQYETILKFLKRNGVVINGHNGVRKYTLNEHYFDVIDTPNKAYILGFLFADGSNCKTKSTIVMSLQEEDKQILEDIRNEIESEKPLEYLDYSSKHDFGYHYKNQYRLLFFSTHMCNSLENIGMIPNKSLRLDYPVIDPCFNKDFIRGYFDGDGSFTCRQVDNCKYNWLITITSTNSFCNKIYSILSNELGVNGGIYDSSAHNNITKVYSLSGKNQVQAVMNWMYSGAEMFLQRKYDKYHEALSKVA